MEEAAAVAEEAAASELKTGYRIIHRKVNHKLGIKPQKDLPFFSFQWHITDECDQRCRHCYIYAEDPGRIPVRMSWTDICDVLRNCLSFCRDFGTRPVFFITGGDPLLHPDFWRLTEKLHQLSIPFVILGNPFHLNTFISLRLRYLGCIRYQMSIDGLEATHDALRKPGSYQETVKKIAILNRAGIDSAVMTTVSSINADELPEIIDAVVKARTGLFSFARYCPTGTDKSVGIAPEKYRELLVRCAERIRGHLASGCRTRFDKKDHLWMLLDFEEGRFVLPNDTAPNVIRDGCHCGSSHLTILPDGEVLACRRVPGSRVGNALTESFRHIWLGPMEAYRKYDRFERCAGCRLMVWCRGCPAVAAGTYGSFYSPDPQCWQIVH